MKITIKTISMTEKNTYIINSDDNSFTINDNKIDADVNQAVFVVDQLTYSWPDKLANNNILDGLKCKIIKVNDKEKKVYSFNNNFPSDFFLLSNYLEEVKSNVRTTL